MVTRERLTCHWTDWVDCWTVDFDYMARKEIIKVARDMGAEGNLPRMPPIQGSLLEYEERRTGGYISENEWQSSRTREDREIELTTAPHSYTKPGRYTVYPSPVPEFTGTNVGSQNGNFVVIYRMAVLRTPDANRRARQAR